MENSTHLYEPGLWRTYESEKILLLEKMLTDADGWRERALGYIEELEAEITLLRKCGDGKTARLEALLVEES
ncbi:MAG: hypothetical protein JRC86_08970 [Deltaproteobacteria bacterium]|nr:hypothetical protein [Deltaproteobacteria bacterium]